MPGADVNRRNAERRPYLAREEDDVTRPINSSCRPDPLELYRWATQDPETQATVLETIFRRLRRVRRPLVWREDFAGTAADAVAWVAARPTHRAIAVERDAAVVAWSRQRAGTLLGRRVNRMQFVAADVFDVAPPKVKAADLIAVLNFSICYFHEPARLREYFRHARRCLKSGGVLVLNLFGGPGARRVRLDRHSVTPRPRRATEAAPAPFEYQWEQRSWDASRRRLDYRIHFVLAGEGARARPRMLRNAFRYDWRLWRAGELQAGLRQAGFADVQLWLHTVDRAPGGSGVFLGPVKALPRADRWVAYVVALR